MLKFLQAVSTRVNVNETKKPKSILGSNYKGLYIRKEFFYTIYMAEDFRDKELRDSVKK